MVASFDDYWDAVEAVDSLVASGFPLNEVRIVASDLTVVEGEHETGGWVELFHGAIVGAIPGAILGFFFIAGDRAFPASSALGVLMLPFWAIVVGAATGILLALVGSAWRFGESVGTEDLLRIGSFDVTVGERLADEAARKLRPVAA